MKQVPSLNSISRQIKQKKDIDKISEQLIQNPEFIEEIIDAVKTEKSTLKFGYEKILRLISEKFPELIYPYFNDFVKLLDSENNFLKWGAMLTIANLTSVDSENRFEKIFRKYYSPVNGPVMISAANVVGSSWKIADAKPELADKIAGELLKVQNAEYINRGEVSDECKNVVCGHAVDSFARFYDKIINKKPVLDFVNAQLSNTRAPVRKKAEKFLRKFSVEV
jgi:hypothetical protein